MPKSILTKLSPLHSYLKYALEQKKNRKIGICTIFLNQTFPRFSATCFEKAREILINEKFLQIQIPSTYSNTECTVLFFIHKHNQSCFGILARQKMVSYCVRLDHTRLRDILLENLSTFHEAGTTITNSNVLQAKQYHKIAHKASLGSLRPLLKPFELFQEFYYHRIIFNSIWNNFLKFAREHFIFHSEMFDFTQ